MPRLGSRVQVPFPAPVRTPDIHPIRCRYRANENPLDPWYGLANRASAPRQSPAALLAGPARQRFESDGGTAGRNRRPLGRLCRRRHGRGFPCPGRDAFLCASQGAGDDLPGLGDAALRPFLAPPRHHLGAPGDALRTPHHGDRRLGGAGEHAPATAGAADVRAKPVAGAARGCSF